MANPLEAIARENFRRSGYITHPSSERPEPWQLTAPPQSRFTQTDTVRAAQQRRARVEARQPQLSVSILKSCLNVLLHR